MLGKIMPASPLQADPLDHEWLQPEFDDANHAIDEILSRAPDIGPRTTLWVYQHLQNLGVHTGTLSGNASLVNREILLMKFIAAVLHSRASMRKWSRTSNVNAVDGCSKLAGKSLDQISWIYGSREFAQWHHWMERLNIPVDVTTIRLDLILRSVKSWDCDAAIPRTE